MPMAKTILEVNNLHAGIAEKVILKGVNLKVLEGETHVIMGPNGSGKSTLANILMGNPKYTLTDGKIFFQSQDITRLMPEERAQRGLFMAFQYPREITGVQLDRFLYLAYGHIHAGEKIPSVFDFTSLLQAEMKQLHMNPEFSSRSVNEGFSGGEKKKAEMLQLAVLKPQLAILDETDSGLDVDALRIVGEAVTRFKNPERAILLVTHYQRILQYIQPDLVHVMISGRIVQSGGPALAHQLEQAGYQPFME